ncbi:hypothetical protein [Paenibacillus sp. FSL L8-0708]|uniref:hypothetical protein n=1 Tax=Paenibacillus sp. FSL L8-0708 TaxID=2975311 RepID=UPI0030FCCEA6
MDKHKVGTLLSYLTEIFDKTKTLHNATSKNPENPSPLIALKLSEIFTLKENAKLFIAINEELDHYEYTSLFNFFDQAYFEMKQVIEKRDRNTSWMYSEFENYKDQHDIVVQMIQSFLNPPQ